MKILSTVEGRSTAPCPSKKDGTPARRARLIFDVRQRGMRILFLVGLCCARVFAAELVPEARTAALPKEKAWLVRSACWHEPEGITGFWSLTLEDTRGVEDLLLPFLDRVRPELAAWLRSDSKNGGRWSWVRRQAVGALKGDTRYLFISYEVVEPAETLKREEDRKKRAEQLGQKYQPQDWRERPFVVDGGGFSRFRVLFDIQKREFVWYDDNSRS